MLISLTTHIPSREHGIYYIVLLRHIDLFNFHIKIVILLLIQDIVIIDTFMVSVIILNFHWLERSYFE